MAGDRYDLLGYDLPARTDVPQRILVVDDEPQIRLLMQRLLRREGYEVETASDGLVALDRLRHAAQKEEDYALVLSDLKMPGVDGLQVLQEVKKHYPDTVFVLITGFATLDSALAALREGVYDYLMKPLDMQHLLSAVHRALEHRALLLQNKRLLRFLQEKNVILESLHQEEQRKTEQLRRVNAIARQITTILDVETLVSTVVELIKEAFDFADPSFGLVAGDELVFRGGRLDGWRVPVAESSFWQWTEGGRVPYVRARQDSRGRPEDLRPQHEPQLTSPIAEQDLFAERQARPTGEEAQAAILVNPIPEQVPAHDLIFPLRAGEQAVGFWVADWKEQVESPRQVLLYLEALAAQTVAVLENARLYALARQADEMAFLNRVARAADQSLDLEETIRGVLTCVQGAFQASLVEICLLNDQLEIEDAFSLVEATLGGDVHGARTLDEFYPPLRYASRSLLGDQFVRHVDTEPLLACGRTEVERMCALPGAYLESTGFEGERVPLCSLVGASLISGERQIGVLGVASVEPNAYDLEDGRLLQVVAGQIAAAIENAHLFQEVELGRLVILESRNTLRTLFDGIQEGIYILDRDKRILTINATQASWAGRSVEELVGRPSEEAFPSSRYAPALIEETFLRGRPRSRTERQRTSDVRWTEWDIHTYPITLTEGTQESPAEKGLRPVDRVVVVVRDVTEQRMLEASLLQSEKLVAVGTLAAGIAHEINNPMTVISANAQILRQEISSTHPYYSSIELIDRASERASKIVRNLLDFSRSEEFELVLTDLNLSIGEAISLVEPQLRKANIELIAELDSNLPAIWASPDHMHVVWVNLLINARDAITASGREGRIRVTSRRHKDRVVIDVADNGTGIPRDRINHVYDPFFTTKGPGQGTGLGLFTCYRTVTRHGGEISVDSQEGEGSTFHVSLPIGQKAD